MIEEKFVENVRFSNGCLTADIKLKTGDQKGMAMVVAFPLRDYPALDALVDVIDAAVKKELDALGLASGNSAVTAQA